ncbi:MAG TPA: GntR family transcriptional regulator [Candidatus Dormibacteraeota bacterium]|nr:GntR family transcriptional regulator [Candidatus Dormibacteraeota bacterium]
MVELSQIKRERAADSIYEALRHAILNHVFQSGERLDVRLLARKFDVSATPVKSAIQMLVTVGLVEIKPRSGTFVARLTARDVAETFDLRRALECLAAESAVHNVTDNALRHLSDLIDKMRGSLRTEDHSKYNTDFHRTLIRLSGNHKLLGVYDALHAHIRIARIHSSQESWHARLPYEQEEHVEILDALRKRDAPGMIRALTKHINRAKEVLLESLKGQKHERRADGRSFSDTRDDLQR